MFDRIKLLFGKSRRVDQELTNSSLWHEVNVLREWLESEIKEKEFYKQLLLEKTGVVVSPQIVSEDSEIPRSVGRKNWSTIRHNLEMESLKKYWKAKGNVPGKQ